jgi:hypothetical protein
MRLRYHLADDMTGLGELCQVTEPVAVVLRNDNSVDVYGHVAIVDQRANTDLCDRIEAALRGGMDPGSLILTADTPRAARQAPRAYRRPVRLGPARPAARSPSAGTRRAIGFYPTQDLMPSAAPAAGGVVVRE